MNYMLTGAFPQEVKYNGKMKNVLNICLNLRPEKRYSSAENLKKAVLHNYSARNDLFLLPGFRGDNNLVKIIALLIYMFYIFSSIIIVYAASIGNNIPQTIFALCFCIFTMGVSMLMPCVKTSSSLLCMQKDPVSDAKEEETACINCGRCVSVCPGHVIPAKLATFAQRGDMENFQKFDGMECCECGCCSYICPAKRPLTQSIKSMRKMVLASRKK